MQENAGSLARNYIRVLVEILYWVVMVSMRFLSLIGLTPGTHGRWCIFKGLDSRIDDVMETKVWLDYTIQESIDQGSETLNPVKYAELSNHGSDERKWAPFCCQEPVVKGDYFSTTYTQNFFRKDSERKIIIAV